MTDLRFHLAPNAPWPLLVLLVLAFLALAVWAYRIAVPPLPRWARRLLPALRLLALALLVLLLGRPVLERAVGGRSRVVVLLDRSASMRLPARGGTREAEARRVVADLGQAWRGRAAVTVLPFAARLAPDSARGGAVGPDATALGDALAALADAPVSRDAGAVVVVSDGAVNAGADPVAAARALGLPVNAVLVGDASRPDRVVTEVGTADVAQVGRPLTVRARVTTTEERGTPMTVRLLDGARELARATAIAPGGGAEAEVAFTVTPARPGLAVWTARVDSLKGERTTANDARQVALEVAPGRLGVLVVSGGLNWDLAFLRRALEGDSSLALHTRVRETGGWRALEERGAPAAPAPAIGADALRGQAVVVLDAVAPPEAGPAFDRALAGFVRSGGGLLALGGASPGLARYRSGALGADLEVAPETRATPRGGSPAPAPEASDLLAWDTDPARGERAWRGAAPLGDVLGIRAGAGDRVLVASAGGGPPLLLTRRVGRGQTLLVNGTGLWRWSLSGMDEMSAERGRALWRRLVHWLAEPAQAEPLRVRPERWLAAGGEPVRLFATLQDSAFRPVAGAEVSGEVREESGRGRAVRFEARGPGSYEATLEDLPPGRYRVTARATRGGREAGRAGTEFAVDRWSLELARTDPDSAGLAALAAASGGRVTGAARAAAWARALPARAIGRGRVETARLWESPWLFGLVVGLLGAEWFWRRRRGLP